jgi:hypothetical protein
LESVTSAELINSEVVRVLLEVSITRMSESVPTLVQHISGHHGPIRGYIMNGKLYICWTWEWNWNERKARDAELREATNVYQYLHLEIVN